MISSLYPSPRPKYMLIYFYLLHFQHAAEVYGRIVITYVNDINTFLELTQSLFYKKGARVARRTKDNQAA